MKKLLIWLLLLLLAPLSGVAQRFTLLKADLGDHLGYTDIFVTRLQPTTFAELNWADTNLPPTLSRRCARFPLRITAVNQDLVGPNLNTAPDLFTNFLYGPVLKDCVRIAIENEDGDILREALVTPYFVGLLQQDGSIALPQGETVGTGATRFCNFDMTGLPNGKTVLIFIEVFIGDGYGNTFIAATTGREELRQLSK